MDIKSVTKNYQPYYNHSTAVINSLEEYIHLVSMFSSEKYNGSDSRRKLVYRGMSNCNFDLRSGLARLKDLQPETEFELINEFRTRRPDAFDGLSGFDILAKMQHYGLPTRLLDFTTNPLVALFFACSGELNHETDGRVLCHYTLIQNDTYSIVNAICNAVVNKRLSETFTLDRYFCNDSVTIDLYMDHVYSINCTKVVRPKYWNQRIANQSGVFMLFFNEVFDLYGSMLMCVRDSGIERVIDEYGAGQIDRNVIERALEVEPLDYYRERSDMYVSDEYYKKLYSSYKNDSIERFKYQIKDRFFIRRGLRPLPERIICEQFSSILIPYESKKRLLSELAMVGISEDFIYPELEYTAKEIKRHHETGYSMNDRKRSIKECRVF